MKHRPTPIPAEDIAQFKATHDPLYWEDLPDDLLVRSLAFAWWQHGQAWASLGRALIDTLPGPIKRMLR
jgi:hypothetical protein